MCPLAQPISGSRPAEERVQVLKVIVEESVARMEPGHRVIRPNTLDEIDRLSQIHHCFILLLLFLTDIHIT